MFAGAVADAHVSAPVLAIKVGHCRPKGCLGVLPPVHGRRLGAAAAPALPGCPPVLPGSRARLGCSGCRGILNLRAPLTLYTRHHDATYPGESPSATDMSFHPLIL